MSDDRLTFRLSGAGWADLAISVDDREYLIENISYLTDALDDLVRMALAIATDAGFAVATFSHEPGTTTLVAETGWWAGDEWVAGVRLGVVSGNVLDGQDASWGSVKDKSRLFECHLSSRDALASLFLEMAKDVESEHGHEGYEEAWSGRLGFPVRGLRALECALDTEPRNTKAYG